MRGGSLSQDKVINLLNSYFVPVYISYVRYTEGDAPADEKREWQRIYVEATNVLKRSGTVHVYILAPDDAKVIESVDIGSATQPERLVERLEKVIQSLHTPEGKPVVKPTPQSCPPPCGADSLVLHLTARATKGTWNEFPVESWIVYNPAETAKLLSAGDCVVGKSWDIDKELSAKLMNHFLPAALGYKPSKNHRILQQSLRATIVSVENGTARARLDGSLKLYHTTHDDTPLTENVNVLNATMVGFMDFEPGKSRVKTLRLLADKATIGQIEFAVGVRSVP